MPWSAYWGLPCAGFGWMFPRDRPRLHGRDGRCLHADGWKVVSALMSGRPGRRGGDVGDLRREVEGMEDESQKLARDNLRRKGRWIPRE